jgi:hypothetical protein
MFLPTVDLLFQFSTTSHPRVGAMNPQEMVVPKARLMSPSQQSIPTANSSPPTLFPTTCTTQGMGSPFTTHSPSGLPTPLQGFQHRLDRKSLCWDLKNSTAATGIHTTTKHLLLLTNFEQNISHRPTTSLPMKL